MMTVMVDTCIIVDALQKREPFWRNAEAIFIAAANDKFTGVITAKALTDIYYLHHRCSHDDIKTRKVLQNLLELFSLSDTSAEDCRNALFSAITDYEDAIMTETAKRIGANCIVTRNLKDYKKSPVPIYSPEQFVDYITNQEN